MLQRIKTGAVIVAFGALALFVSKYTWAWHSIILVLSLISIYELCNAMKGNGLRRFIFAGIVPHICFALLPNDCFGLLYIICMIIAIAGTAYLFHLVKTKEKLNNPTAVAIPVIVSIFFDSFIVMRRLDHGLALVAITILVPMFTDIFAYLCGRAFGKHKLAPEISPKKTIEGAVGGTVLAVAVMMLIVYVLTRIGYFDVHFFYMTVYMFFASIVGQLGDLAFSAIKRIEGIKDYGNLMPGHGGILDRFDSSLFVFPFTFLFFLFWGSIIA